MNHLDEFTNPPACYRGAPFWAWNCTLNKDTLLRQLEYFKQMGLGGATVHCRTGLGTEYMGAEFMELVRACVEKARELDMNIYLYDEDRWPSGFGGGLVTREKKYRAKYIVFTPVPYEIRDKESLGENISGAFGKATGEGELLTTYAITLDNGYLKSYRLIDKAADASADETVWYAYLEISKKVSWYNNQAYVDTLSHDAIDRFIETTHEKYYAEFGDDFGKLIPSIFTDEPQFVRKSTLGFADERADIILPYTTDFEESFKAETSESFLEHLPEIIWELPNDKRSYIRYKYHEHLSERFAEAYSDNIGKWCDKHGIALTGHMMEEQTLESQTHSLGEAMRQYLGYKIPGIDMLCDRREYITAKQAQSAAHQLGCSEITSEIYGVTNWDFDFRGHKLAGDWQAALGVTRRVQHLSWVSMEGEAKRDYPASISYQSPWYKKYSIVEDHFARVNTALLSGKPDVKIGVIHPIESYWLYYGPQEQTAQTRSKLEKQFEDITEWLLCGLMDFDYISEGLTGKLTHDEKDGKLCIGEMAYNTVLVPGLITMRSSTLGMLKAFHNKGGKIIFLGDIPSHVDAVPSDEVTELAKNCTCLDYTKESLMSALAQERFLDMLDNNGVRTEKYISQIRELDGEEKIVFIANGMPPENSDIPKSDKYKITIKGLYTVQKLCTNTGNITPLYASYDENGNTIIEQDMWQQDSLLIKLTPGKQICEAAAPEKSLSFIADLNDISGYSLCEQNVLLLDQFCYSINGGNEIGREEALRADTAIKRQLGYPTNAGEMAQPWVDSSPITKTDDILLKYNFVSDIEIQGAYLAIERLCDIAKITFNGTAISLNPTGYYVDEAIETLLLPTIKQGENTLSITMNYTKKSQIEWCYILGDFGVEVIGNTAKIVTAKNKIGFTDITAQGMPFYGGNLSYFCSVTLEKGDYVIEIPKYRNSLLSVSVDGKEIGDIAFAPYRLQFSVESGEHEISITAYGNRINTFGAVHNCDELEDWAGPNLWRTEGAAFSYEYQLKPSGILKAPMLYKVD